MRNDPHAFDRSCRRALASILPRPSRALSRPLPAALRLADRQHPNRAHHGVRLIGLLLVSSTRVAQLRPVPIDILFSNSTMRRYRGNEDSTPPTSGHLSIRSSVRVCFGAPRQIISRPIHTKPKSRRRVHCNRNRKRKEKGVREGEGDVGAEGAEGTGESPQGGRRSMKGAGIGPRASDNNIR
jgi:hypothetical protein